MQETIKLSFWLRGTVFKSSVLLGTGLFASSSYPSVQDTFDNKYTTTVQNKKVFMQQVSGLNYEEQDKAILGFSFYRIPWVEAPAATTARDGLGPLFNANTCISCHPNNAVGSVYNDKGQISRAYVMRLSVPSDGSAVHQKLEKYNGFVPEPNYGGQVSVNGVHNVPFEAKSLIIYETKEVMYPDGEVITLSKPKRGHADSIIELNYGKLHNKTTISKRLPPAFVGLGLLEQVTDAQILANEDINDSNSDGISGKANIVYSPEYEDFRVGRYTWKASAPTVLHQAAGAAYNDMSLSNPLFAKENCTSKQKVCLDAPKGDSRRAATSFDLPMPRLEAIAFYLKNLKVPKSIVTEKEGENSFAQIGCVQCHSPSFTLTSGYVIKPFTDMLLHDMGEGLSDGRTEFKAEENEWRTAPLWGIGKYALAIGKSPDFLHDGRAKTLEEAILWHGGEAKKSRDNFMSLSKSQREAMLRYINEL